MLADRLPAVENEAVETCGSIDLVEHGMASPMVGPVDIPNEAAVVLPVVKKRGPVGIEVVHRSHMDKTPPPGPPRFAIEPCIARPTGNLAGMAFVLCGLQTGGAFNE